MCEHYLAVEACYLLTMLAYPGLQSALRDTESYRNGQLRLVLEMNVLFSV